MRRIAGSPRLTTAIRLNMGEPLPCRPSNLGRDSRLIRPARPDDTQQPIATWGRAAGPLLPQHPVEREGESTGGTWRPGAAAGTARWVTIRSALRCEDARGAD